MIRSIYFFFPRTLNTIRSIPSANFFDILSQLLDLLIERERNDRRVHGRNRDIYSIPFNSRERESSTRLNYINERTDAIHLL